MSKLVIAGLTRNPGSSSRSDGLRIESAMTALVRSVERVIPGLIRDPGISARPDGLGIKSAMTALVLSVAGGAAFAQMTPVGVWHSIDDKTGQAKAEIRIAEAGGSLSGRIEKLLRKDAKPDEKCVECKDDRRDKPMVGLEIIRAARKAEGKDVWEDGRILDPENGRDYALRLTPIEAGKKLEVRGSLGPFGRTQTWVRAQ